MFDKSDLRKLYTAFEAVRFDARLAPLLGELITELGVALHPPGQEEIGEFSIGDITYRTNLSDRFGRACVYGSRQEHDDLDLFLKLCRNGATVWDIGANFGLYAVAAARKAGSSGRIYAAEPSPRAAALLRQNVSNNSGAAPICIFPNAIADFDGNAVFHEAQETAFSGLSDTHRSAISSLVPVEVRRLDALWNETGRHPIDLIKIDVEGHEADVLNGAREAILASPNVVIQFEISAKNLDENRQTKLLSTLHALQTDGMALWHLIPQNGTLTQLPLIEAALPKEASGNVFMVRHESPREEQLIAAAAQTRAHPPTVTTELETAFVTTLGHVANHYKSQLNRLLTRLEAVKNTTGAPAIMSRSMPVGRRLRPFALASVESLTAVIRVTSDNQDIERTIASVTGFCRPYPVALTIADCRPGGAPLTAVSGATMITPPADASDRYERAMLAALRAAETTHALLVDADGILQGNIDQVVSQWRQAATDGRHTCGVAFSVKNHATPSAQEETFGGMLAMRYGLLALEPLRISTYGPAGYRGDGVDLDLSLHLWNNGFVLIPSPSTVCFLTDWTSSRPSRVSEDEPYLQKRWAGVFTDRTTPTLFRKPRPANIER